MRLARVHGGEYIDVEEPFDPGNTFTIAGTFTAVPDWLRRFMYRILKPQEIAVYLYVCSFMQRPQVSWVSLREMQRDFGLTNRHELISAINELERLGFLLRTKGRVAKSRTEHDRNIFQRPALAYTLLTLLEQDAIDGHFHPTVRAVHRTRRQSAPMPKRKGFNPSFLTALAEITDTPTVKRYLNTPDADKSTMLHAALSNQLAHLRASVTKDVSKETTPSS
jgi:hypothetical protein